jgi:hypothetical protein
MINFEVLANDAEKYKNKRFPSSSVEPFWAFVRKRFCLLGMNCISCLINEILL